MGFFIHALEYYKPRFYTDNISKTSLERSKVSVIGLSLAFGNTNSHKD